MLENVHEIFDFGMLQFRRAKKKMYEERIAEFREKNGTVISEMLSYVANAEDKDAAAGEVSEAFCKDVFDANAKRGKLRGSSQQDCCLFMIYYVFPSILLTEDENAAFMCDKLLESWRVWFKNPGMQYGTYDDLHDSFREKIFGLI